MNARTKTLFHFTKSLNVLMRIFEEGFWPQYSLEDTSWIGGGLPSHLAWPMVSFCDIPISRLSEHTIKYGSYGIGLCRERLIPYGLNPLLYLSPNSVLKSLLAELISHTRANPNRRIGTCGMYLFGNCKPLEGNLGTNGIKRDFYSECEWRYIPWVEGVGEENKFGFFLSEEEFHNEETLKGANEERRKQMPTVEPDDVRYLLVKTREDVHKLIDFIDTKIAGYSPIARDVLKTRIVVLNDIQMIFDSLCASLCPCGKTKP